MTTPAQVQLFKIAFKASEAINKAINGHLESIKGWLTDQYGATPPTYDQFWSDREALKNLAAERGLVDDQWVRKPYNMAVKALYGELPVSTTVEAVAKRAVRISAAGTSKKTVVPSTAAPASAKIKVAMPKDAETAVRQMLEHYGMAQVLIAFSTILGEYRATAKEAIRVKSIGDKMLSNPELAPVTQPKAVAMH